MTENKTPYLCGGVMFFLLLQTTLPNATPGEHENGIKDAHAEPVVMRDLIYTFTGTQDYGSSKDTSQYKECSSEGSVNLPFNDIAVITSFDNAIRNKYPEMLSRMAAFLKLHINPEMEKWFVCGLLEILENDDDIDEKQEFYINGNGLPSTKNQICTMSRFEFEPFVLGILHFILISRREKNHLGVATLDLLGTKKSRKPRVYNGNIGDGLTRQIEVIHCEESDINNKKADSSKDESETEKIEAEVVDDTESSGAAPESRTTIIQQQTNIVKQTVNNFDLKGSHDITFNL